MWVASLPEKASTHCVPEIKSWSARDGSTFSMRTGSTAFFLLIARSTSRATKSDSLLALDRTRMKPEEVSMPLMISSP